MGVNGMSLPTQSEGPIDNITEGEIAVQNVMQKVRAAKTQKQKEELFNELKRTPHIFSAFLKMRSGETASTSVMGQQIGGPQMGLKAEPGTMPPGMFGQQNMFDPSLFQFGQPGDPTVFAASPQGVGHPGIYGPQMGMKIEPGMMPGIPGQQFLGGPGMFCQPGRPGGSSTNVDNGDFNDKVHQKIDCVLAVLTDQEKEDILKDFKKSPLLGQHGTPDARIITQADISALGGPNVNTTNNFIKNELRKIMGRVRAVKTQQEKEALFYDLRSTPHLFAAFIKMKQEPEGTDRNLGPRMGGPQHSHLVPQMPNAGPMPTQQYYEQLGSVYQPRGPLLDFTQPLPQQRPPSLKRELENQTLYNQTKVASPPVTAPEGPSQATDKDPDLQGELREL